MRRCGLSLAVYTLYSCKSAWSLFKLWWSNSAYLTYGSHIVRDGRSANKFHISKISGYKICYICWPFASVVICAFAICGASIFCDFWISRFADSVFVRTYILRHCIRKPEARELLRLCPETSTKFYVHEFDFSACDRASIRSMHHTRIHLHWNEYFILLNMLVHIFAKCGEKK
jgi:hypothetical protein